MKNNNTPINNLYLTWENIELHAINLSQNILNYFLPDILISVGRGGMIPARLVSECIGINNIKIFDIKCYNNENKIAKVNIGTFNFKELEDKSVVLIDDVYTTGTTIDAVIKSISSNTKNCSIYTASLYYNSDNIFSDGKIKRPDVYSGIYSAKNTWIVFPWENIAKRFSNYKNSSFT